MNDTQNRQIQTTVIENQPVVLQNLNPGEVNNEESPVVQQNSNQQPVSDNILDQYQIHEEEAHHDILELVRALDPAIICELTEADLPYAWIQQVRDLDQKKMWYRVFFMPVRWVN